MLEGQITILEHAKLPSSRALIYTFDKLLQLLLNIPISQCNDTIYSSKILDLKSQMVWLTAYQIITNHHHLNKFVFNWWTTISIWQQDCLKEQMGHYCKIIKTRVMWLGINMHIVPRNKFPLKISRKVIWVMR